MLKKLSFFCFQPKIIKPEKRQQYNTAPCTNAQPCVEIPANIYRCAKRTCSLISQFEMAINKVPTDRPGCQKLKYRVILLKEIGRLIFSSRFAKLADLLPAFRLPGGSHPPARRGISWLNHSLVITHS